MDKVKLIKFINKAKQESNKKKFVQSVDLIINLKNFDTKNNKIEEFIHLPAGRGKDAKICAIVGAELKAQSEKECDQTIISDHLPKWTDQRKIRKLTRNFDFFIAQATIMPQIAQVFGKYFGPMGKMPNPKAGQIVPPNANISPIINRLKNTVRIVTAKDPVISCKIGTEKMDDNKLSQNAAFVIDTIEHKLPVANQNIKSIFIKTTMGRPIKIE